MSRRPRRYHSLAFKRKAAVAAIKGEKTLAEQFDVHANQITSWRTQLLEGSAEVFGGDSRAEAPAPIDVKELHAKIGELTLTNDDQILKAYLRAYASVPAARVSIGRYIDHFYNTRRPHSSLDRQTPDEAYFNALSSIPMAA